jgi:hypothetical protein
MMHASRDSVTVTLREEQHMADEKNSRDASSGRTDGKDKSDSERVGKGKDDNSEWLRDQVGEDHNLSGSSTYRTLPDQPESASDDSDDDDLKRKSSRR